MNILRSNECIKFHLKSMYIIYKILNLTSNKVYRPPCICSHLCIVRALYASSALHLSSLSSCVSFLISSMFISNNMPVSFAVVSSSAYHCNIRSNIFSPNSVFDGGHSLIVGLKQNN